MTDCSTLAVDLAIAFDQIFNVGAVYGGVIFGAGIILGALVVIAADRTCSLEDSPGRGDT